MNILLVNSLYTPNMIGGAEVSVQDLAETLVHCGHRVSVACLGKQSSSDVVKGVQVHYLRLANIYWPFNEEHRSIEKVIWHIRDVYNLEMARAVGDIVVREKPDVVHTNNLAGFSVAVWDELAKRGVPIVHTIRDMYLLCVRSSMFQAGRNCDRQCLQCRMFSRRKRNATRQPNHVVGISNFVLRAHQRYRCFQDIPSSIVHNSFRAASTVGHKQVRELRFGYLGSLAPAKGVAYLVDTYLSSSVRAHSDLLIAGEGYAAYYAELKAKSAGTRVRLVGRLSPGEFFPDIDVLVVPSLWKEPLGRVVIEAYAHGVPVIVSNRGGLPEIVIEGKTGFIFEPGVPLELQSLLEQFTARPDLARGMGKDCLEKAKEFLPEHVAGKYLQIYSSVLKGEGE